MSQPIDVEYVEIRARGERETARDIHNTLKDIEKDVNSMSNEVSRSFDDMSKDIQTELKHVSNTVDREISHQNKNWRDAGETIAESITIGAAIAQNAVDDMADKAVHDLRRMGHESRSAGKSLAGIGADAVSSLFQLKDTISDIGTSLFKLGTSGGVKGLAALSAYVFTVAPAIVALGGSVLDLVGFLGLLPAALGVVIGIGGTLMLTFKGIGEAVSALASGDVDKIKEAFKSLGPSTQKFAKEINNLRKPFGQLQKTVQESFFKEFTGSLTKLATVAIPVLKTGLSTIATSLGKFGTSIADLLSSNDVLEDFGDIFESTGRIIDKLSPIVTDLFGTLIGSAEAGLPFLERFFDAIGTGLSSFDKFLSGSLQDGSFNKFLEDAFTTMGELVDLGKALGSLFVTIFGESGDEGNSLIKTLTDITNKLNEFFKSADGKKDIQQTLDGFVEMAKILIALTAIAIKLTHAFIAIKDAINTVISFVTDTAIPAIGNFFQMLGDKAAAVGSAIGGFFTSVGNFFVSLGQSAVSAYNTVVTFLGQVVAFFIALPGKIVAAIAALPGLLVAAFYRVFDAVTFAIGFGIGAIMRFFIDLPGMVVSAISSLVTFVSGVFNSVLQTAINITLTIVNAVVSFFTQLPGRVYNATVSVISYISGIFSSTYTAAVDKSTSILNAVVSTLQQMPGKVASVLSSLPGKVYDILRSIVNGAVDIGADIIRGVGRGIENGTSAVIDLARRAAHNIIEGMKKSLGIASPSRLAADEIGEPFAAGVGVGVTSGESDIVKRINGLVNNVMPSAVASSAAGASSSSQSITFGPGAIQVNVSGNASRAEASVIGQTVGQGIIDALNRKRVQLQIRTI